MAFCQIFLALHFHQARYGTLKFEMTAALLIKIRCRHLRTAEKFDVIFIKHINEGDKTLGFVSIFRAKARNPHHNHRMIFPGYFQVIRRPQRRAAKLLKRTPLSATGTWIVRPWTCISSGPTFDRSATSWSVIL